MNRLEPEVDRDLSPSRVNADRLIGCGLSQLTQA